MRKDTNGWYAEDGEWVQSLDKRLRERPPCQPEPTSQDLYYDTAPYDERPEDRPTPYVEHLWDDPERMT